MAQVSVPVTVDVSWWILEFLQSHADAEGRDVAIVYDKSSDKFLMVCGAMYGSSFEVDSEVEPVVLPPPRRED